MNTLTISYILGCALIFVLFLVMIGEDQKRETRIQRNIAPVIAEQEKIGDNLYNQLFSYKDSCDKGYSPTANKKILTAYMKCIDFKLYLDYLRTGNTKYLDASVLESGMENIDTLVAASEKMIAEIRKEDNFFQEWYKKHSTFLAKLLRLYHKETKKEISYSHRRPVYRAAIILFF